MRTFRKNLVRCLLVLLMAASLAGTARAKDKSEQYVVTIKTYIISGSAGLSGLSFPVFPHMSLAILEETIPKVEMFYDNLRALYAFNDYRLLAVSSGTVRLAGYPRPTATRTTPDHQKESGMWHVDWKDFTWDKEGRLQMSVRVDKENLPFIESHISVLPGRSVILGRFADREMKEAVFAIVVPEIDVAAVTEKDLAAGTERFLALEEVASERRTGLPPVKPEKKSSTYDCPEGIDSSLTEFIAVSQYPELINQPVPVYPESAIKAGAEGKVWVNSMISREGIVLKCCVLRSSGREDLDQSAVEAAQNYQYKPALDENGNPVVIWVAFQVVFRLEK